MSDRFAGKISIGGQVPSDKVEALINAINDESIILYPYWSDNPFCPQSRQDLIESLDESNHIVLCDDQAHNGMFDYLEDALTELSISWKRWSESYCEYDAEIVWWHPGMDGKKGVICDTDGNELVLAEPVKEAYALLHHCFSNHPDSDNPVMLVHNNSLRDDAMKKLASVVIEVPVLPPLELIE